MKQFIIDHYKPIFVIFLVLLLGLSFYTGFLEGKREVPPSVTLSCDPTTLEKLKMPLSALLVPNPSQDATGGVIPPKGLFIGSKNGTKYYSPSCANVKRIKPENYVWFDSVEDATLQGYSAGNC